MINFTNTVPQTDNKFVFVCPMFNASKTLERLLYSLAGQSYENWKIILIDDVSDENEVEREAHIISKFVELRDNGNISVTWNKEKKWEVANVLHGIGQCDSNDVVCRIDADDYLTDLDALYILNEVYKTSGSDVAWTAHRWGYSDKNISAELPVDADVYKFPWVTSHLKTFRKKLIEDVNDENFRGPDGEYIRRAGDQALYLPILHKASLRVFVPRVMYHYTIDDVPETYQTDDAKFQRDEAQFIRQRGFVK